MSKVHELESDGLESDFERKANELDFDVWGTDSEESSRRRDPLRRRSSRYATAEDEDEDLD